MLSLDNNSNPPAFNARRDFFQRLETLSVRGATYFSGPITGRTLRPESARVLFGATITTF
jgi:hypothetical protein